MIETDAIAIAEQVNALVIKNKDDFVAAGELAVAVARRIKQKNEQWRPMFERANESATQIKNNWNKEIIPLQELDSKISRERITWKTGQDGLARIEQERLEKEAREKAEKERQKLLEKAAEMEKLNPKKAEALLEKAEAVVEKPVFVERVVEKTTKMETGGSITWIKDIEVEVVSIRAVCHAISQGFIPENCVEFKNLKQLSKLNNWKGQIHGLNIKEIQRESKRI